MLRTFKKIAVLSAILLSVSCSNDKKDAAKTDPTTEATTPVETGAPLVPQNALQAAAQAEIRKGGFTEALRCDSNSGLPKALSVARYELLRFDKGTLFTDPSATDSGSALIALSNRIRKVAPFMATDLQTFWRHIPLTNAKLDVSTEATFPLPPDELPESQSEMPLPAPENPILIPQGCTLVPVIAVDKSSDGYVLDGTLWADLEPIDQAALLIQLRVTEWTMLFEKKNSIAARKYVRALLNDAPIEYVGLKAVTDALGDEAIVEYGFENGDSLFARRGNAKTQEKLYGMTTACQFRIAENAANGVNPAVANRVKNVEQLSEQCERSRTPTDRANWLRFTTPKYYIFPFDTKQIGRVELVATVTAPPIYLASVAAYGFGNDVVDFTIDDWKKYREGGYLAQNSLRDGYHWSRLLVTYSTDQTLLVSGVKTVCRAGTTVVYSTRGETVLNWTVSPEKISFERFDQTGSSQPMPLVLPETTVNFEGKFLTDKNDTSSGRIEVTKSFSMEIDKQSLTIGAGSKIARLSKGMAIKPSGSPSIEVDLAGRKCSVTVEFLETSTKKGKAVVVQGKIKPGCRITSQDAIIEAAGRIEFVPGGEPVRRFGYSTHWNGDISPRNGDISEWNGDIESDKSDIAIPISVYGQKIKASFVVLNEKNELECFSSNDEKIRYFRESENKMMTTANSGASDFVVNREKKRLDEVFYCPLKRGPR